MLECIQRRATKIIPELRYLSCEECLKECGLTTTSVNMFKNKVDTYIRMAGYT